MSMLSKIFPTIATNEYRGSPIAFYALCLFGLQFTVRSLIHYFKEDGGANSIASIITFPGTPDPDAVIYLAFSLWGGAQILITLFIFTVLCCYRSLIPLMFLMIACDMILRIGAGIMNPLTAEFYEYRPPGSIINLPLLILAISMFFLSLREPKKRR
jgi:hypothetical protein